MEFQFDLVWRAKGDRPDRIDDLAEALAVEPTVMINPALDEMPVFVDRLYQP
jgi:predicted transcriptional regulator